MAIRKSQSIVAAAAAGAALVLAALSAEAATPSLQVFDHVDATYGGQITSPFDIRILNLSGDGSTAVGYLSLSDAYLEAVSLSKAFNENITKNTEPIYIRDGVIHFLPFPAVPGESGGIATGVSYDGSVIVGAHRLSTAITLFPSTYQPGYYAPDYWTNGQRFDLPAPASAPYAIPSDVSNDGSVIVGRWQARGWRFPDTNAAKWTNEVFADLGAGPSNNGAFASGVSASGSQIAIFARPDRMYAVSADGKVLFGSHDPNTGIIDVDAIRIKNGTTEVIPWGGFAFPEFWATNGDGSIAVGPDDDGTRGASQIYFEGQPVQTFVGWLASRNIFFPGSGTIIATSVSDDGTVFSGFSEQPGGHDYSFIVNVPKLPGDANFDGNVNSADFQILAMHFNQSQTSFPLGDFNEDGRVNALDFNILCNNYGQSASAPLAGALVPEPASIGWLVTLAGLRLTVGRKNRGRSAPREEMSSRKIYFPRF